MTLSKHTLYKWVKQRKVLRKQRKGSLDEEIYFVLEAREGIKGITEG